MSHTSGSPEADARSGFGEIAGEVRKRIAALERVKLDGYGMVISELRVELNYLERATKYLEK